MFTRGNLDTQGTLYDSAYHLITGTDSGGELANFRIARELTPGTYYVEVKVVSWASIQTGSYTFHLEGPGQYTLSISKSGTGSGTVTSSPAGINCGSDCSEAYNQGTVVTLTATSSSGSTFTGWSGGGCSGTGSCTVTMDANKTITATFTVTYTPNFYLSFPLPYRDSSSAVINSVFDHHYQTSNSSYCADGIIVTYCGDEAIASSSRTGCGTYNNPDYYSYSPRPSCIINYNPAYTTLSYDGHPGYDYKTTDQSADGRINVLAAADGNITFLGCLDTTNSACYGTIEIDHGNFYKTRYLHLSRQNVINGQSVTRGQVIGISGDTGSSGSPHLHFEVTKNDIPVDPYGWEGSGTDPYTSLTGVVNENLWFHHCDFNGDGKTDILWRNKSTGQDVVWLMNGTTYITYVELPQVTDTNWQIVGTGDFSGDGKTDILWRNKSTGQDVVWLMNGTTYITYVELPQVPDTNWEIVGPK